MMLYFCYQLQFRFVWEKKCFTVIRRNFSFAFVPHAAAGSSAAAAAAAVHGCAEHTQQPPPQNHFLPALSSFDFKKLLVPISSAFISNTA
jgi:hypothetical protein